jgi:ankyrin repeat protein
VLRNLQPEHRGELIGMLAAAGANPNATDWMGKTPLHNAEFSVESVKPLLAAGANLEARDRQGNTPLLEDIFVASFVRELLADGADPAATNTKGEGALDRLKQLQCDKCRQMIEQALSIRYGAAAKPGAGAPHSSPTPWK